MAATTPKERTLRRTKKGDAKIRQDKGLTEEGKKKTNDRLNRKALLSRLKRWT